MKLLPLLLDGLVYLLRVVGPDSFCHYIVSISLRTNMLLWAVGPGSFYHYIAYKNLRSNMLLVH
jgi:hypothetical protein